MFKYGVLAVSAKGHQSGYSRNFMADPRCHIVAVADERDTPPDREKVNRALAQELGVPYIPDLDEALARQDVHIASVCVEVERRGPVATKCALAGKHIFLDKPSAASVKDAYLIAQAVEHTGVRSQMMSYNHSLYAEEAKQAVADGHVGKITAVHGDMLIAKATVGEIPSGFVRREKEKSTQSLKTLTGCHYELSCWAVYPLPLIHQLLGSRTKNVLGMTGNYFSARHLEMDVEDFGALLLKTEDGTTVSITGSRIPSMSHPLGGWVRVTIVGTEGVLTFGNNQPHLEAYSSDGHFARPEQSLPSESKVRWATIQDPRHQGDVGRRDIGAFVDCIQEGRETEVNAKEAATVVEVLRAGYISAARGEPVTLPLPR